MADDLPKVTFVQMSREAQRELALRHAVYEKRVKRGEMSINEAAESIRLMRAIVEHFKPLAQAEEAALALDREKHEPRMF